VNPLDGQCDVLLSIIAIKNLKDYKMHFSHCSNPNFFPQNAFLTEIEAGPDFWACPDNKPCRVRTLRLG